MKTLRHPIARSFYPGECSTQIRKFLEGYTPPGALPAELTGAVVPHAGWSYSGAVAARTLYTLSQHAAPEICIVFGADHTGLRRHTLYPEGAWSTPLGELRIDDALGRELLAGAASLLTSDPAAHQYEHSIEVTAPMLKHFWPNIYLLPIIVAADESAAELGSRIGELIMNRQRQTLLVASSDLTHYGAMYDFTPHGMGPQALQWMERNDRRMIERLLSLEATGIVREALAHSNACGSGALAALLGALSRLGVKTGRLIEYTGSFEQEPENVFTSGVGYAGIVY